MSDNGRPRAATYARVSTWDKHGDSIESQQDLNRVACEQRGYELVAEYVDRSVSGAEMHAPDLERALGDARQGHWQILVTRELDRFARSLAKQLVKESEFREAGAVVEYAIEEYEDSPHGRLIKHVRAIIADYEREKVRERIVRGRARSAALGNVFVAGNAPLGYDIATVEQGGREIRTLAINEDEAYWIRRIYEWYVYGDERDGEPPLSDGRIAQRLTAQRVPTKWDREGRGRRTIRQPGYWSTSAVQRVLTSSTYMGRWPFTEDGAEVVVPVPAIIGDDLWERAQRRRARAASRSPRSTRYDYLLRGRLYCDVCGYRISARAVHTHKRIYYYYRCCGANDRDDLRHNCASGNYRVEPVDARVWEALKILISDPELVAQHVQAQQNAATLDRLEADLALAGRQVDESQARLKRLLALTIEGQYSQEIFLEQQRALEAEIARRVDERDRWAAQLAAAVDRVTRASSVKAHLERVQAALEHADADFQRRRWLVEVLDVEVRLRTYDDNTRQALLFVDGEHVADVELPSRRHKS